MRETVPHNPILLAPGGGPTLTFMGAKIAYKATDGPWALLEHSLPENFAGAPPHWHKITHHGFYVLEGRVTFQLETRIFSAEAGAFISVPAQTLHTFSNPQTQPACLLEIIIPGGLENSFKELVTLAHIEPGSFLESQKLLDIYKRYDTFMPDEL